MKLLRYYSKVASALGKVGVSRLPGARTFYRFMYRKIPRPSGMTLLDIQGSKMYVDCDTKSIISSALLADNVYEECTTKWFHRLVYPGMVIADIGANIGYYTLIAAKLVGNNGVVYAYEPEPSNYELLCKNITINGYINVVPVQKAVSNTSDKQQLYIHKAKTETASLARPNVLIVSKDVTCLEIETVTLDEFFQKTVGNNKLDFIKVDAQGAEGLIIDGAEMILRNNKLTMIMEFDPYLLRNMGTSPQELLCKLRAYGFGITWIDDRSKFLKPIDNIDNFCCMVDTWQKTKARGTINLVLGKSWPWILPPVVGQAFEKINTDAKDQ